MSFQDDRLAQLRAKVADRDDLDALIVSNLANVRYLTGFSGTNATLLVGADRADLLTDFRYVEQAAEQTRGYEISDGGSKPRERLVALMEGLECGVGFDEADMRVKSHQALAELMPDGLPLVAAAGLVEELRAVKDAGEIATIARACELADGIYAQLAEEGIVGRTEAEVAWRIAELARSVGASGLSFEPIVAAGPHGALPHAEPRNRKIDDGQLVVLDLGIVLDGYCSDCTRTFATGVVSERDKAVYEIVLDAQQRALEAVRAGALCSDVDAVARELISEAGHADHFGHSLGHGVGVEVHEQPTLATSSEATLEPGNVVTVEPGIYLPGEVGVRIEDLVVVTEDEPRVLTNFTKELITVS